VKDLQAVLHLQPNNLRGIGIGAIGPLDTRRGGIDNPPNLPGYRFIPLVEPLTTEFRVAVNLLNDCVAGVVGERTVGPGASEENLAYITISTGIGCGVYVDGHLLLGKDGNAHEVGHVVIDHQGKLLCGCGKRGHWEAYCSGRNLPNYARMILEGDQQSLEESILDAYTGGDLSKLTARMIYDGAKKGDRTSLRIVEETGRLNAIGFANVVNVYDPALISVGGKVVLENEELILNPIKRRLSEYVVNKPPKIGLTSLGEDIVLYGALAAAFSLHRTYRR